MDYFENMKAELERAYAVAAEARSKGIDPSHEVEITIAKDIAARVEGLVGPPGIGEIIREMEKSAMKREDIAFSIVKKIAGGEIKKGSKEQMMEQAIRTGVSILTEGVLVAPTEGITRVKIRNNPDGSDYISVYYAGPIRSAGGTVAALSVALADVARRTANIGDYRATDTEVERYVEEVNIYEARVAHLQYKPPDDDVRLIVKNCPICIDGEGNEDVEVSVYRNIPRVETNKVRGGVPLVICEGIAQKAAKMLKYTKKLELGWEWLEKIIKISKKEDRIIMKANDNYLEGLVAGRPVFAYPSAKGGFRLRYGKSRTNGIMAKNIHPATMILLDEFLAYGTHMKIERPGKGCVLSSCENIEPPVVKLQDGSVVRVRSIEEAERIKNAVKEILFLGDILCTYGDFLKSNHPLLPAGFCEEWWAKEVEAKGLEVPKRLSAFEAFSFAKLQSVPLHPDYTFPWHDINAQQLYELAMWFADGRLESDERGNIRQLVLSLSERRAVAKRTLEELYAEHYVRDGKVFVERETAIALLLSLGMLREGRLDFSEFQRIYENMKEKDALTIVNALSGVIVKPKAPTYIGARMGRPEKAKERPMAGDPNILFPTGMPKNRNLSKIYKSLKDRKKERMINVELIRFRCTVCSALTFYPKCHLCGGDAKLERICQVCNKVTKEEMHCGKRTVTYEKRGVDVVELMENAKRYLNFYAEDLKGVKGLGSSTRIPERIEKGFLRSKYNLLVFRDGTIRFDATDVPLTHFIPREIGVSVKKLKALGYDRDYLGEPLISEEQLVPLKAQDVVVAERGADYLIRVTKFIDDMLVNVYHMKPFYNVNSREELIGHLAIGLSPHTSTGVLCRIIGFTKANVGYGHPYFHTAKRRNCFSGRERIPILKNGRWYIATMKEVVEEALKNNPVKTDDFGTVYCETKGLKTVTFNKEKKRYEIAEIGAFSKHRKTTDLIEITTSKGRKIRVTADHPMLSPSMQKIAAKDATDVVLPAKIKLPARDIKILNVGAKRDTAVQKRRIMVDKDFAFLIGYCLAKGRIRKQPNGCYQLCLPVIERDFRELLLSKMRKVFGIKAVESRNRIIIDSRILHDFLLDCGIKIGAKNSGIPSFILSLPEEKVAAFLFGMFYGNGRMSKKGTNVIGLTSVNRRMIDDTSFLLSRLGIMHSIDERWRSIKSNGTLKTHSKAKGVREYKIMIYRKDAASFMKMIGFNHLQQKKAIASFKGWQLLSKENNDAVADRIVSKKICGKSERYVYSLTVAPYHTVMVSGITAFQCDGDEDGLMMLLDGLINFSKQYLSKKIGGTMDTPLVLTMIIDPKEVDDEAHLMEVVHSYPLEFYRAAERYAYPNEVSIKTIRDVLGTPLQYDQIPFTHHCATVDDGPTTTAYVKLKSIPEKIAHQFALQKKIRAVDVKNAAERLIVSHFIPDLYGNMRSFSRQTFRCSDCNEIYRRVPLKGKCVRCGGNLLLTINKGGIEKYLEISRNMAEEYGLPDYLKQRLELLSKEIGSVFEDDKIKQMGLTDFM